MAGFILTWIGNSVAIWLVAYFFDSVSLSSWQTAFVAGLVLAIVNAIVRPILVLLTLPITVVTLGLFMLVLNAGMVALVAWLVPGFTVSGFWTAVGAAIIVGLVSWAASSLIGSSGRVERFVSRR